MHVGQIALILLMIPAMAYAKESDTTSVRPTGYVDVNRDGINDRFADANGDGINEVTKKPYPHRFGFKDDDKDKVNDLFVDQDGDGVNDRSARFVDNDGDGICDNVVDYDGDGVNDITGVKYTEKSLGGYRYGFMDEERGIAYRQFIDEDGDGMHDFHGSRDRASALHDRMHDYFIDEDGDGIRDGRGFGGRGRGRMGAGGGPHRQRGGKR
jgi:hypothetical protein